MKTVKRPLGGAKTVGSPAPRGAAAGVAIDWVTERSPSPESARGLNVQSGPRQSGPPLRAGAEPLAPRRKLAGKVGRAGLRGLKKAPRGKRAAGRSHKRAPGENRRMIMATKLLNQRIKDVMCARKRAGQGRHHADAGRHAERTHILYVNAHFKPYAATGYESSNKVRPQSGNPSLGGGVTFSIPQFNPDCVRVKARASGCDKRTAPSQLRRNQIAGTSPKTFSTTSRQRCT